MNMNDMQSTNSGPMSDAAPTPNGGMSTDFTFTTESLTGYCKSDSRDKMKSTDADSKI